MSGRGRLAIDFGTSNTVLATWDGEGASPLHLPGVAQLSGVSADERVPLVPSVIYYGEDQTMRIGNEVVAQNLHHSPRTFRAMKRYISTRSPVKRRMDGREISHFEAARDFLSRVMSMASDELALGDEEIALTVPVEAYEHYDHWLSGVVEDAGFRRIRLLDEASAAALGYQAHLRAGDAWLVFDFGGGTLDVSVIVLEDDASGRRCRVLGKAGADIGGVTVDQWIYSEVLRRHDKMDSDDDVRAISRSLLVECERVKEALSTRDRADLSVIDPMTGVAIYAEFTRGELENLLDQHEAYATITRTVQRALAGAQERGYRSDDIAAVLLVGGSALIPSVQRTVQHLFGRERVRLDRPMDAVARGAAAFLGGLDLQDHIQHDYAIRFVNPARTGYDYKVLVSRGTQYPTREPLAEMTIKASTSGQTHLGLAIFEVGQRDRGPVELVFDASGAARLQTVTQEAADSRAYFWMNQQQPTFLRADPPAAKGEPRFRVSFTIDANKRLLITAVDLQTQRKVFQDYPVIKLI